MMFYFHVLALMQTEYEIKFYDLDPDTVRHQLFAVGASCRHPRYKMKRLIYHLPGDATRNRYLRVRDEGTRITTSLKSVSHNPQDINAAREIDIEVSDFETMCLLYDELWFVRKAYQETYREAREYTHNDTKIDIVIDWRPQLKPFIEIESSDEASVRAMCEILWYDYAQGDFGAVDTLYQKYAGISQEEINKRDRLVFKDE